MRWKAIDDAVRRARATLVRFPFVLLAGFVCATAALIAIEQQMDDSWLEVMVSATLGLPLLFAITMTGERRRWPAAWRVAAGMIGLGAVALFWWGVTGWSEVLTATRYVQLNLACHLLAAFLPFVAAGTLNGFWQYNRSLFLRFLIGAVYTVVLFAGLAIALLAIDNLFGVNVSGQWYVRLLAVLAFIFNPWFFLAGVPADLDALDGVEDYPIGLKVFTQFVLIPLVSVYIVILTLYLVRILVTQTWPSGWIGWLVSSVAAAGTLALLLVHPIRERADSRWVDVYGRWFYVALLPSIAMLLMAIWQRIQQYAITENRYFLLVGCVWLGGIALYYGITGSKNIRVIPLTLCLVALLTYAGPWSAYNVARDSQLNRFRTILRSNDMLADGQLQRPPASGVPVDDRRELSAILRYTIDTHGQAALAAIDPVLADTAGIASLQPVSGRTDHPAAELAMQRIGLEYLTRWERAEAGQFFYGQQPASAPIQVAGFETMYRVNLMARSALAVGSDTLVLGPLAGDSLPWSWRGRPAAAIALRTMIEGLMVRGVPREPTEEEAMRLVHDAAADDVRLRLIITQINGRRTDTGSAISSAQADVLVGRQ